MVNNYFNINDTFFFLLLLLKFLFTLTLKDKYQGRGMVELIELKFKVLKFDLLV